VLFATQPAIAPPRFVLFTTGPLESAYRRFVERRLRETYGFPGTPIDLAVKARERRRR
jgi:GTP-binding protein